MATFLQIGNFKNIGNGDIKEEFCINRGKNNFGDITIIIGSSNSGKSNLLKAISKIDKKNEFSKDDIPYYIKESKDKEIELIYLSKEPNDTKKAIIKEKEVFTTIKNDSISKEELLKLSQKIFKKMDFNYLVNPNLISSKSKNEHFYQVKYLKGNNTKLCGYLTKEDYLKFLENNKDVISSYIEIPSNCQITGVTTIKTNEKKKSVEVLDNKTLKLPNVYQYNETKFKDEDLKCKYSDKKNLILTALISSLEENPETFDLTRIQNEARSFWNDTFEDKMKKISLDFNNIFLADKYFYEFKVNIDSQYLELEIIKRIKDTDNKNEQTVLPMKYSLQSSGFKWFFNFYFGFLLSNSNKLKPGDILLLDEPACMLSYNSIKDLRTIFKNFAHKKQIQVVIVTHNHAWIDIDNLEEVREVYTENTSLKINNDFNRCFSSKESKDCLSNLARCVETNLNQFSSYLETKFILVEGITDYMYLTTAKLWKQNKETFKDLCFIPINGIGMKTNPELQEQIYQYFSSIYPKHYYLFLTDSDENGKSFSLKFKEESKDLATLLEDSNILTIEDLLSDTDIEQFRLEKKTISSAYNFKQHLLWDLNFKSPDSITKMTKLLEKIQSLF